MIPLKQCYKIVAVADGTLLGSGGDPGVEYGTDRFAKPREDCGPLTALRNYWDALRLLNMWGGIHHQLFSAVAVASAVDEVWTPSRERIGMRKLARACVCSPASIILCDEIRLVDRLK